VRGETVLIASFDAAGSADAHGNTSGSWDEAVAVPGCLFAPGSSEEPFEAGRNAVVSTPTVYAPPGTTVSARDRVTVRGNDYEVIGDPGDWRWPTDNRGAGVVIPLRRVSG
jgi:hypothetical protein